MRVNYSFSCKPPPVERPHAGSFHQEKDTGEQLGIVGTYLVQDGPKSGFRQCGWKRERTSSQQDADLGGQDGYDHFRDEVKRRDPGEQSEKQEEAAEDLGYRYKMGRQLG